MAIAMVVTMAAMAAMITMVRIGVSTCRVKGTHGFPPGGKPRSLGLGACCPWATPRRDSSSLTSGGRVVSDPKLTSAAAGVGCRSRNSFDLRPGLTAGALFFWWIHLASDSKYASRDGIHTNLIAFCAPGLWIAAILMSLRSCNSNNVVLLRPRNRPPGWPLTGLTCGNLSHSPFSYLRSTTLFFIGAILCAPRHP